MNQQLQDYITQAHASGVNDAEIKTQLLAAGWDAGEVSGAVGGGAMPLTALAKSKTKLFIVIGIMAPLFILGGYTALAKYTLHTWPFSSSQAVTPTTETTPLPTPSLEAELLPLGAPSQVKGVVEGGTVNLSWKDNSSAETKFDIGRRPVGGAWSSAQVVEANVTTYTGLQDGSYEYSVTACNTSGCSDYSDGVTVVIANTNAGGISWVAEPAPAFDPSLIPWSESRKLAWSDFKSPQKYDSREIASVSTPISSGINLSFGCKVPSQADTCMYRIDSFSVFAVMDPNASHVEIDKATDSVLAHEQLHFDIAEAFARRSKNQLNTLVGQTGDKATLLAKKAAMEPGFEAEMYAVQDKYDADTNNGNNSQVQAVWASCVKTWLSTNPKVLSCSV